MANDYLSSNQAAKFLSFSLQTMYRIEELGKGPPIRREGTRPYHWDNVIAYRDALPRDLNKILGRWATPLFAEDVRGIWRMIVTRSEAYECGARRYFDGRPCGAGHIAERFTKNCRCTECCEVKARRRR